MSVLSKYSKTKDVSRDGDYLSQQQYMEELRDNNNPEYPDDFRTPFTYQEWIARNAAIIPGQEYAQYQEYVKSWHQNTYTNVNTTSDVKEDYINLLKEIQLAFEDEEEFAQFSDINFDNNLEIEDALPLYVKRLKDIAIYFINKRESLKRTKLKYNMTGSRNALERLFYEYLLKSFTTSQNTFNIGRTTAYNSFPELSSINTTFNIFVEELYDDGPYFDKDPDVDINTYYNLSSDIVTDFFETRNFDTSALPWLYETGIDKVYANNPLVWTLAEFLEDNNATELSGLPLSAFELFEYKILNDYNKQEMTEKYMGGNLYGVSGGYYIENSKIFTHDFDAGNNWFYWPSGEYIREVDDSVTYDNLYLSGTNLITNSAIAAIDYKEADKIFVSRSNNIIEGAWLKLSNEMLDDQTMSATLFGNRNTKFRFPYPGYGVSGDGIAWGGPEIFNTKLPSNYDEGVLKAYWNTIPTSAINIISIHDTTLIDSSATPAYEYHNADKLSIRVTPNEDSIHDENPNSVYKQKFDHAWLYKMAKTDLPIPVGQTYISWPIKTYETGDSLTYLIPSSQCISMNVSSINVEDTMVGSRAGHGVFDSDLIYKLDAPNGYSVECAWLSGSEISTLASPSTTLLYNATGSIQPSLTLNCKAGNEERFIWYDQDTYITNTSFNHNEHQIDCDYLSKTHTSIYATKGKGYTDINTNGIGDWNDCTCRAIRYSPLGHPGNDYGDYGYMTDTVFVDTQFPNRLDLNTWRGTDDLPYDQSKDFAFFQVLSGNQLEPDVGWGNGTWKTGDGSAFEFKQGVVYKYVRSNIQRNPGDLIVDAVPSLIVKQQHVATPQATWMRATLGDDGMWSKTTLPSDMVLNPGDYLMYDHIDSNWYCLSTEGEFGYTENYFTSAKNIDTEWADYDFVTSGTDVSYIWPNKIYTGGPSHILPELSAVSWTVTPPVGSPSTVTKIDPLFKFIFEAEEVGTYTVTASGYGPFGTEAVSILPNLTSSNLELTRTLSGDLGVETTYNDRINMLVNIPLSGWDYSNNTFSGSTTGSRPFWAKAYDDSSQQTKFKGTMKWGGGLRLVMDDYSFLSQPDLATVELSSNTYFDYYHNGVNSIIWDQPIEVIINEEEKTWCKLDIDESVTSPLSSYLYNIDREMIVSATDVLSNMLFIHDTTDPMLVNYWSTSSTLIWTQKLYDSSLGQPPSGGIWVEATSGTIVDALVPYANLTNRHFPTIASMPYIGSVYSDREIGGYFVPKNLGANTYLGKSYTNLIDTSNISNTPSARGDDVLFRDPELYTTDRGLTQGTQFAPISTVEIDSGWMKSSITSFDRAGTITNAKKYQEFIPYQTRFESTGQVQNGMTFQSDEYDPWNGDLDNSWIDPVTYPPNFRNEYDINGWYDETIIPNKLVYQWKTDIFGNQYALMKDTGIDSVYQQSQALGSIWTRDLNGRILPSTTSLSGLYNISVLGAPISADANNMKYLDLWFDTLMLETTGYVVIEKINFDYDTNSITFVSDDIHVISLSADNGGHFGGTWLFDEKKEVTLCTVQSDDTSTILIQGTTWNVIGASAIYRAIDMSSDGMYQTAVSNIAYYRTSDYGVTWTSNVLGASGADIAMSSDGMYQIIGTYNKIEISDDYGVSFTEIGSSGWWLGVAMSSDGKYQSAISLSPKRLLVSDDYGVTWTNTGISESWQAIEMSYDGKYQTAVGSGTTVLFTEYIYTSDDYGVTWNQLTTGPKELWKNIAISEDGKYQTATATRSFPSLTGKTYRSDDYGATWNIVSLFLVIRGVAMSADGKHQTAVSNDRKILPPSENGYIHRSSDYGVTWTQTGIPTKIWNDVAMSYDGRYQSIVCLDNNIYQTIGIVHNTHYYPKVYNLDLNTNVFVTEYNGINDTNAISGLSLSSIEDPVFTYNNITNNYNLAFIGYSVNSDDPILTTMTIPRTFDSISIKSVVPNDMNA